MEKIMTSSEWENFVKGDVVNFLVKYDLQSIQVADGAGKKGKVSVNSNGQYKVQVTSSETM